jgi:hypothetical protein
MLPTSARDGRAAACSVISLWRFEEIIMAKNLSILVAASALLMGAAIALAPTAGNAASVSERICSDNDGTWDKSTKTCHYETVETKPGDNKGKASWETESSDTAHGNLKNPKSTHDESCEGPGGSTSKC